MYFNTMKLGILSPAKGGVRTLFAFCLAACAFTLFVRPTLAVAQTLSQPEPLIAVASAPGARGFSLATQAVPSGDQHMHLVFQLKTASLSTIQAFIDSQQDPTSQNYHRWLTSEQFGEMFGASDSDIETVVNYLQSRGFTVSTVWPNRAFISVDTDVDHVNAAFGVHVLDYIRPANQVRLGEPSTFYSPDAVPTLPASIASCVNGVLGLSDYHKRQPQIMRGTHTTNFQFAPALATANATGTPFSSPLVPAQLSKVYDTDGLHTAGANGTGMKIAIFSPTTRIPSDVTTFATQFNLGTPDVEDILVDGGATAADGPDEAALDGEVIVGQAPRADVRYYESPNTDTGTLDAYNQMGTDGVQVVSSSWGAFEDEYAAIDDTYYETGYATAIASLATLGISVFNASGDTGAYDDSGTNAVSVLFEAADPNLTGVGGTSLPTNNNGYYDTETAWSYTTDGGDGGGGGLSTYFTRPSWQTGPGVINSYSNGMRQVPDISALADPNTPGYYIIFAGFPFQVGGTSASTPLWASATLLMDELGNNKLGNIDPALYSIGTKLNPPTGLFSFHDITSGNDGVYPCTQYWDFATGWGSAEFTKLYDDMTQLPDFLPTNPAAGGPGGAWTSPIMIHTSTTSVAEPVQFNTSTSYRIAACVGDDGVADGVATTNELMIDGVAHTFAFNPIQKNTYLATLGAYFTSFSAGTHTIELIANSGNASESSRSNNTFTRTITVVNTGAPAVTCTLSANSAVGGVSVTGTVTLATSSATARIVSLSGTSSVDTVPASVTVPANSKTATFTVTTSAVQAPTNLVISATYSGSSSSAFLLLTVPPPATATITSVTPPSISAGAPAITITVTGTGFVPGAYIQWNSVHLVTTYVNSTTLTAVIPASLLTAATSAQISEVTPGYLPTNAIPFSVTTAILVALSCTAVRDDSGNIFVQVTIQNVSANRVGDGVVQVGSLNGVATETGLPISLGPLGAGASNTVTLEFPSGTSAHNVTGSVIVEGSYTGGSFALGTTTHIP